MACTGAPTLSRWHLIRFGVRITLLCEVSGPPLRDHGVLAPNAKLRALVVPRVPEEATGESALAATESGCTHARPARAHQLGPAAQAGLGCDIT